MIAFGPVPSRRLGQSLGINNIPPKISTYSCIYCQVGRTIKIDVHRKEYYKWDKIIDDVRINIKKVFELGETIDNMRKDAVRKLLSHSNAGWELINKLISEGKLIEIKHKNQQSASIFY